MTNTLKVLSLFITLILVAACSNNPGEENDKTLAGAVLGAGWGAGTGAIVGHQLDGSPTGEGVAIGAGLGMVAGAAQGMGYDQIESEQLKQERRLDSLQIKNKVNRKELRILQAKLDRAIDAGVAGGIYQVFFDVDATSLRAGAIANLETIAESIKGTPGAYRIAIVGHTDDSGDPEYNSRLAEVRARNVSSYIAARGISFSQLAVSSVGGKQPIASNSTPAGRQLNRRVDVFIQKIH